MPIFHFNLADHEYSPDESGTELASVDVARIEAVIFAGAYLRDHPELVWDGRRFEVQVTDDDGQRVFTIAVEANENIDSN